MDDPRPASQTDSAVTVQTPADVRRRPRLPHWLVSSAYGFGYWLVFLLVLEPDNVLRASQAGYALPFAIEAARIGGAALLGAVTTPILIALTRRFPVVGDQPWRNLAIHLLANACLGFALIVASCFVASWGFEHQALPSQVEVRDQLTSNWTLLVFALCAFTAIVHVIGLVRRTDAVETAVADIAAVEAATPEAERSARIPIKAGGRLRFVEQASIDWMETQGNYVALHAGANVQLLRRTLTDFEVELEAGRFVRIHRRMIVAIDRMQEMKPLPNGDATLRLRDGQELRVSRSYREEVVRRWRVG